MAPSIYAQPGGTPLPKFGPPPGPPQDIVKSGDRVTTEETRPARRPPSQPIFAFPAPQAVDTSLSLRKYDLDGMAAVELKGLVTPREKYPRFAPMVLSPDGRWLYVLDGRGTIHKLHSQTLQSEATLATGAECGDIAISQEGLVVCTRSLLAFWILDGETLRVKREIPVDTVTRLAASPNSSIAYGSTNWGLCVVDLRRGELLNFIGIMGLPGARKAEPGTWNGSIYALHASADGKYLFTYTTGQIHRMRVQKEQLFFEESTPDNAIKGMSTYFCACASRNWIVLPSKSIYIDRPQQIPVYGRQKLDHPLLSLESGGASPGVGFDEQTGNVYVPVDHKLHVFNPAGEKIRTFETPLTWVRRVLVYPDGERIVLWSDQGLTLVNMKRERLNSDAQSKR